MWSVHALHQIPPGTHLELKEIGFNDLLKGGKGHFMEGHGGISVKGFKKGLVWVCASDFEKGPKKQVQKSLWGMGGCPGVVGWKSYKTGL